jgi:hypothetical protein
MATYKILGVTDTVTTCECCGKSNLKHTVAFETDDMGVRHYGSSCIAKIYGKIAGRNAKNSVDMYTKIGSFITARTHWNATQLIDGIWNKFGLVMKLKNGVISQGIYTFNLSAMNVSGFETTVSWWAD